MVDIYSIFLLKNEIFRTNCVIIYKNNKSTTQFKINLGNFKTNDSTRIQEGIFENYLMYDLNKSNLFVTL